MIYLVSYSLSSPGPSRAKPKEYLPELSVGGNHVPPPHVNLWDFAGIRKPSHTIRGSVVWLQPWLCIPLDLSELLRWHSMHSRQEDRSTGLTVHTSYQVTLPRCVGLQWAETFCLLWADINSTNCPVSLLCLWVVGDQIARMVILGLWKIQCSPVNIPTI